MQRPFNAIKLVSAIHASWGTSIIAFYFAGIDMPRPFGSQEAFLEYMPPWAMASVMLAGAALCRFGLQFKVERPFRAVCSVVPQQAILLWSTVWGIIQLGEGWYSGEFDARGWLALCYLCALSWYHASDIMELWRRAFGRSPEDAK